MIAPLFHIGYHKTATTWFQRALYPHVRNRRYVPQAQVRHALITPNALHFDPAIARQIVSSEGGIPICCEENLTGGLHSGGLAGCQSKDIAHRIHASFPDAHIVIFVRDQVDAIAAAYVQYVKGGGTHGVDRYLFGAARLGPRAPERDEIPRFQFEHFAYDRLIAQYDALFGEARVHVYRYEHFRADRRAFMAHFARHHDLDIALDKVDFSVANPGLSVRLLRAMRVANRFTRRAVADKSHLVHLPGWYKLSRRAMRQIAASGWNGRSAKASDILPTSLIQSIRHRFRASNAWLDERMARQDRRLAARPEPEAMAAGRADFDLCLSTAETFR
ncbi:sulfotransferase [Rhizorhabdus sp. FW153]|uniref:sulfotransferase n=1 Tax=Rhizorhabdus sp. FW153 TaxID=3400216 RepID=UPI003CE986A9